jgi:hypothetical protein
MTRFISGAQAESKAEERIIEYEQRFGELESPPVPVERLIDEVFDLRILWEPINTMAGLSPAAALRPSDRRIVVNENRTAYFDEHPEYLHFAFGHELGHWDLHVDQATLDHPMLAGTERATKRGPFQLHSTPSGDVTVLLSKFHTAGYTKDEAYAAIHEALKDLDSFFEARQVNRYAGTLLMPERLIRKHIQGRDLLRWQTLYDLAGEFQVSITALKIRLETMGLIYVTDDRKIHPSKAEYLGQGRLFQ